MKRSRHPILLSLAIIVTSALVNTALAKWVWHGPGPVWLDRSGLWAMVTVALPITFIVRPFLSPAEPRVPKSDAPSIREIP